PLSSLQGVVLRISSLPHDAWRPLCARSEQTVTEPSSPTRYVANPVVVATLSDGVLLKRGSVELRVTGPAVAEMVSTLLDACAGGPRSRADLLECFPAVMQ